MKFIVKRPEIHYAILEVEAANEQEAFDKAYRDEDTLEIDMEFHRTMNKDEKAWMVEVAPKDELCLPVDPFELPEE